MSILGFIYYNGLRLADKFFNSDFLQKRCGISPVPVGTRMTYDIEHKSAWKCGDCDYVRLRTLELIAELINASGISSAVAELGVYKGDFSKHINRLFPQSKLYLFDTFEGFDDTELKKEYESNYTNINVSKWFKDTSVELVLSKMETPENCIVRKGYFPETAEGVEDSFMFVSIDCDLYDPILAGLRYFYPRLVAGGAIMIHDYNHSSEAWQGVKPAIAEFEKEYGRVNKVPISDHSGTLIIVK